MTDATRIRGRQTGFSRRHFLGLAGQTGIATVAARAIGWNLGLVEILSAATGKGAVAPFSFAIITDSHLFSIPNHKFDKALEDAVAQVNALAPAPDFVVYTGDIAQNGKEDQLVKGKSILAKLKMPLKAIPGEHDWYLDLGKAWNGLFGRETWSFDHKGVHLIGLNSILVRDFWTGAGLSAQQRMGTMEMLESPIAGPWGVRDVQLEFLRKDVAKLGAGTPIVIFTHSPLWDYYPRWNFQTEDAPQIREILSKFDHVVSMHGHVHQTIFNKIGNLSSAGALSTSWPWPYPPVQLEYPGSQMNQADPANTKDGMGTQVVNLDSVSGGVLNYEPFANSLSPWLKEGVKV
jgi:3',5'-cyclic AMP phosphodiesterase CpdA